MLLIGAAAVGAYAVTMLVRSTVFTLGAMFAVVVGATLILALIGVSEAWFPNKNLGRGHLERHPVYYVDVRQTSASRGSGRPRASTAADVTGSSCWTGVRNLGVLLVAAVAASVWSFRRRDVP